MNCILIDPCNGQDCSGQGTCRADASEAKDGYACTCNDFYTGDNCEHGKYQKL